MKKFILTATTAAALISSTAQANAQNSYYIKGNIGAGYLRGLTDKDTSFKLKSQVGMFFGAGVGYYIMENVRIDLTLDHYVDPELKKSGSVPGATSIVVVRHKANLNTLMVNGLVDLLDVSIFKIFTGVGVGISRINERIYKDGSGIVDTSTATGAKNNITYAVHLGASTELNPGINADLTYSWRDFGRTKSTKNATGSEISKTHYRGHHLAIGFRFDM
jgi:opacity protein-like surface antigen